MDLNRQNRITPQNRVLKTFSSCYTSSLSQNKDKSLFGWNYLEKRIWKTTLLLLFFILVSGLLLSIAGGQASEQQSHQHNDQYRNYQINDRAPDSASPNSHNRIDEIQQISPTSPLTSTAQTEPQAETSANKSEQQTNSGNPNGQSAAISISTPIRIGSQANQMSLVLVGAILVGLIMVVGLVLGCRR